MARRKIKTTRLDIIKCASTLFLEQGYSATSPRSVCDVLDIGTGNLTYYFPTKEHMLAVLVDMLCDFQWKMMEREADEGFSSIMALCLELTAMVSMCDEDAIARDFYLSAYTSTMCLDRIRKNDIKRAKLVFREHCSQWTEEQFAEAAALVSGIEYAALVTVGDPVSLETRISGALNLILDIFHIPPDIRKGKIERVLSMDYRGIGRRVLQEFRAFVAETNEQAIEALISGTEHRSPSTQI